MTTLSWRQQAEAAFWSATDAARRVTGSAEAGQVTALHAALDVAEPLIRAGERERTREAIERIERLAADAQETAIAHAVRAERERASVLVWRDERGQEICRSSPLRSGTRRIGIPLDAQHADLIREDAASGPVIDMGYLSLPADVQAAIENRCPRCSGQAPNVCTCLEPCGHQDCAGKERSDG